MASGIGPGHFNSADVTGLQLRCANDDNEISGRQLNLCILQCLEHERPLVAKVETVAAMEDDVAAGGRACEPDDSLSDVDCPKTAAFPKKYQLVADEPDCNLLHSGRSDLRSAVISNQASETVNDLIAPAFAAEVCYPSSPKYPDRLRAHVFNCEADKRS